MISKTDLEGLELKSMDEYFNYIVESEQNGQFKQVKELVNNLSEKQYKDFLMYIWNRDIELKSCYLKG